VTRRRGHAIERTGFALGEAVAREYTPGGDASGPCRRHGALQARGTREAIRALHGPGIDTTAGDSTENK
jgi:hypothetical protein